MEDIAIDLGIYENILMEAYNSSNNEVLYF